MPLKQGLAALFAAFLLLPGVLIAPAPHVAAAAPNVPIFDGPAAPVINAAPEPPRIATAFSIGNTSSFSETWFSPQGSDSLRILNGGVVYVNQAIRDNAGDATLAGIQIDGGGKLIIDATNWTDSGSPILNITANYGILCYEAGEFISIGTEASRCSLVGGGITNTNNKLDQFGYWHLEFTDLTSWAFINAFTEVEYYNCTFTGTNSAGAPIMVAANNGANILAVNCTIDQTTQGFTTALGCVIRISGSSGTVTLINCVLNSFTDNRLATGTSDGIINLAGCTYRGAAIEAGDISVTSFDINLRIYEASAVTSNVAGARISVTNPLLNSYGLVDNGNYSKMPGYLHYPGSANCTIFLLNRTGTWPSGLAVASRTWFNISNGADVSSDKWNISASAPNYYFNSTEVYSGTNASVNLTAIPAPVTPTPGLEGDSYISTYSDALHTDQRANITYGDTAYIGGSITFNDDISCYANMTLEQGGTILAWIANASWNFNDGVPVDLDTLFGIAQYIDTGTLTNGTYDIVITFQHEDIENTTIRTQFAVLAAIPAQITGLEGDTCILPYNSIGNFQVNYTYGTESIYPEGWLQWSVNITNVHVNTTVRNDAGTTILWLGNQTYTFTADIMIALSTIYGAPLLIDTNSTGNGSFLMVVTLEHPDINRTYVYGEFAVLPPSTATSGTGDGAAILNIVTYSDNATTIECNNFTFAANVVINGTITTNLNITNASVIISLYNSTGFMSELANNTWNFTTGIAYNLTEINAGIIVYWTSNASGQYYVRLNVTNASTFFNNTATTEGFYIYPAAAAAGSTSIVKPMVDWDMAPLIELAKASAPSILGGFIVFIIVLLIIISIRTQKKKGERRWSLGPIQLKYSSRYTKRKG